MFSIFTYVMSRVTDSEPGLPMGILGNFSWDILPFPQSSHLGAFDFINLLCVRFTTNQTKYAA